MSTKVAVLVLNHNGKQHLSDCFGSLKKQAYNPCEVYLVDNCSKDGSVEYVRKNFPWVKIMAFGDNLGFAKAYNHAIENCDADFVALLNNDTKVDRRWLCELVNVMSQDSSAIVAGSKLLFFSNPQFLNHAGASIASVGGGFDIGILLKDTFQYSMQKPVGAVCGASMLLRKDLFVKLGGFDEDFFAYFEDLDFCWRSWLYGYKTLYVPSSVAYHKLGGSFGRLNSTKAFLVQRNRLTSILKNFDQRHVLESFLVSILYDSFRIVQATAERSRFLPFVIIKGYFSVFFDLGTILQKRMTIQSHRVVTDKELISMDLVATFRESLGEYIRLRNWKAD